MTDAWRCFVAVPLNDELRSRLADAVAGWRAQPGLAGLRWVPVEDWHITLAFLGDTPADRVPVIGARLRDVGASHAPMSLPGGRLGAFPRPARARIAWYGPRDAGRRLARLAGDVAAATGVDEPAPFTAHVTLGRVAARGGWIDLRHWVREDAPRATLEVDRLELIRSHLAAGPTHYETLVSVPLGGPADD